MGPVSLALFPPATAVGVSERNFSSLQQLSVGCFKPLHAVGFHQVLGSSWKQFQDETQAMTFE